MAIRGADSVCVVTQKKVPERLIDPTSVTNIYEITPKIGAVMTGMSPDSKAMVSRIRYEANQFEYNYGYTMPVHVLAKRIADLNQLRTQQSGLRILACTTLLVAVDDEKGPTVMKVDPAGHFAPYKAAAAGNKEQEAVNYFEKRVGEFGTNSTDDTIRTAIMCLGSVLGSDFRGSEVEVASLTGKGKFGKLTRQGILPLTRLPLPATRNRRR